MHKAPHIFLAIVFLFTALLALFAAAVNRDGVMDVVYFIGAVVFVCAGAEQIKLTLPKNDLW